jgi:hypothetical protein
MKYKKVTNLEEATHWIPERDENNLMSNVTVGQPYKIYFDQEEQEYFVIDNEGLRSLVFLAHNGVIARLNN